MLYRVQEWLADHTRMQYPRIRAIPVERKPVWGENFSLLTKIGLFLLGVPLLLLSVALFCFGIGLLYLIVSSWF